MNADGSANSTTEKPWYKDSSILISVSALIFSIVSALISGFFNVLRQRKADQQQTLEELQQLTVDLIDNRKSIVDIYMNSTNLSAVGNLTSVLNSKQKMLLSRADSLARMIPAHAHMPAEIPFTLGSEHQTYGEYADAITFYQAAIDKGDSVTSQVYARRALALLYMLPGTGVQAIPKAETLFKEALDHVGQGTDENSISLRGFIFAAWGGAEYYAGNPSAAMKELSDAEKAFRGLQPTNTDRPLMLEHLKALKIQSFGASARCRELAQQMVGEWTIAEGTSPGKLVIAADADSGRLTGSLTRVGPAETIPSFPDSLQGPITFEDESHATFSWSGQLTSPFISSFNAQGKTVLAIRNNGTVMDAVEERPGSEPLSYTLVKIQQNVNQNVA
jgi:tetratricopeptide (TPR) repeat protein